MVSTVYIIHPSDEHREALAVMVAAEADGVCTFESSERFLEAIAPGAFGCVIAPSDVPAMGLPALVKALRARGLMLPVVALGRDADVAAAVQSVRAGAAEYLEPPVSGRRLRSAVQQTLHPHRK